MSPLVFVIGPDASPLPHPDPQSGWSGEKLPLPEVHSTLVSLNVPYRLRSYLLTQLVLPNSFPGSCKEENLKNVLW